MVGQLSCVTLKKWVSIQKRKSTVRLPLVIGLRRVWKWGGLFDAKDPMYKQMKYLEHSTTNITADPNPDAQVAYEERVRLFENVQGWEHYNTDLSSQGGGVFSRSAKSIPISTEVQQMLGLLKDQTELAPEVVIRILLRLDVDLLWNGGIGTYVKATDETHMDAGDPSNDNLRVNGSELRSLLGKPWIYPKWSY